MFRVLALLKIGLICCLAYGFLKNKMCFFFFGSADLKTSKLGFWESQSTSWLNRPTSWLVIASPPVGLNQLTCCPVLVVD